MSDYAGNGHTGNMFGEKIEMKTKVKQEGPR